MCFSSKCCVNSVCTSDADTLKTLRRKLHHITVQPAVLSEVWSDPWAPAPWYIMYLRLWPNHRWGGGASWWQVGHLRPKTQVVNEQCVFMRQRLLSVGPSVCLHVYISSHWRAGGGAGGTRADHMETIIQKVPLVLSCWTERPQLGHIFSFQHVQVSSRLCSSVLCQCCRGLDTGSIQPSSGHVLSQHSVSSL